jgi:ankyrin repeat protein
MPTLPARPNLGQLRRQAKELLRAAASGDPEALQRIGLVSDRVTLSTAQLALARGYGFASWRALKAEVDARTLDLAAQADAFCRASVGGDTARAVRMLHATPELARYSFATAVVVGDAARVRAELDRDPGLATRTDARTGWTALHAVSASRWHQAEPARAPGLLSVARLLLAAGADPVAKAPNGWSPLRCAIAASNSGPSNRDVVELLLERGAVPDDHDLYLAGFAHDRLELLELLLAHVADPREIVAQALAPPIGNDDAAAARLLLEAGADPSRHLDDDGRPLPIVWAAIRAGCSDELLDLLLVHHADPSTAGPDGRTPFRLATASGRADLVDVLRRHGAGNGTTAVDELLFACLRGAGDEARRLVDADPELLARLGDRDRAALVRAAGAGNAAGVALMLDLGFPLAARGDDGATALHAAAYSGRATTVRLLVDRGAETEARDTTWDSTPLVWAAVGSGEQRADPAADWEETVRILLEAGASTAGIAFGPDDPKQPSAEVAALLRSHGG